MTNYSFKLYVIEKSIHAKIAVANLQYICDALVDDVCEVTVVDVISDPEQAEIDQILATPTLIKESPLPQRRVIGDLSDLDKVKMALGLGL